MDRLATELALAATAGTALLTALADGIGLGLLGVGTGLACLLATCLLLAHGVAAAGRPGLSPADQVTLARAVLVAGVTALVADSLAVQHGRPGEAGVLTGLAVGALLLDALDGRVARRRHACSALGARFDMEVDALLILLLSLYQVPRHGWVLAIGLARYGYLMAGWLLPWLAEPVPPRYWAKVVAAIQGVVLTVAAAGVLPTAVSTVLLVTALALLAESFGHQIAAARPVGACVRIAEPVHG